MDVDTSESSSDGVCENTLSGFLSKMAPEMTLKLQHLGFVNCSYGLEADSLPYLRSLTSFRLARHEGKSFGGNRPHSVWRMFMQEKIVLQELDTSELNTDLFEYLLSFEGLKKAQVVGWQERRFELHKIGNVLQPRSPQAQVIAGSPQR